MDWNDNLPQPSQIIRTKVKFYHHYGIFVSEDEVIQFGLPDDPGKPSEQIKVLSTNIDTFLCCSGELETASYTKEEKKTIRPADEIIKIARSKIGEGGYDILHNNCEHFASDCVFGQPQSTFLQGVREKLRQKLGK